MIACLTQFTALVDAANFEHPSTFTLDFSTFYTGYGTAMAAATDLSSYMTLMFWDTGFAFSYFFFYYSVLFLLSTPDIWEYLQYVAPIHAGADVVENITTWMILNEYVDSATQSWLIYLQPLITPLKWTASTVEKTALIGLALWRLVEWI